MKKILGFFALGIIISVIGLGVIGSLATKEKRYTLFNEFGAHSGVRSPRILGEEEKQEQAQIFEKEEETALQVEEEQTGEAKGQEPQMGETNQLSQENLGPDTSKEEKSEITVSEEELFERLYPESYRTFLTKLQDNLIKGGYLKESQKRVFTSQEAIVSFLEDAMSYWIAIGVISEERAQMYKEALRGQFLEIKAQETEVLREKIREEKKEEQEKNNAQSLRMDVMKYVHVQTIYPNQKNVFKELTSAIESMIAPRANAQADCFREGAPNGITGSNLWAPCCDCNCGNSPCGCLNAVCQGVPAIWDPLTGICGCAI